VNRVIARPLPAPVGASLVRPLKRRKSTMLPGIAVLCLAVISIPAILAMQSSSPPAVRQPAVGPRPWPAKATLLTVYGRGFGVAPVLGRLGLDHNLDDVAQQLEPARRAILANSASRPVKLAIHLIYALATPCSSAPTCLLYLDDTGADLVKQYIEPAARRGWTVILDDQLGGSSPKAEIARLMSRGYLAYDNVEVAFDPEFRSAPGQDTPGIPTGYVTAAELNGAQTRLNAYAARKGLAHQKVLLVHEWIADMIRNRRALRSDLPYVLPVVVMDGIGAPDEKARAYQSLVGSSEMRRVLRGIKLFPPNPYDSTAHVDDPQLSWPQLFGREPAGAGPGGGFYMRDIPHVIVLT
jgi:hypothetical protein